LSLAKLDACPDLSEFFELEADRSSHELFVDVCEDHVERWLHFAEVEFIPQEESLKDLFVLLLPFFVDLG
jgi:hypothetical protein